jgi:hypothetical protein
MTANKLCGFAALTVICLVLTGCGGKPGGRVEGKVVLDDVPLPLGEVVIAAENGSGTASGRVMNGAYVVEKAPLGPVKVFVTIPMMPPPTSFVPKGGPPGAKGPQLPPKDVPVKDNVPPSLPQGRPELPEEMKRAMEIADKVPKLYRDEKTTPLRHTVEKGTTTFNVIMTTKGIPGMPPVPEPPR